MPASSVAILAGAGVKDAVDEVLALADTLGAGIAKAILAKTMIPDDVDYVTGTVGLLGTEPSDDMMAGCDTFLMVGTRFPYAEFLPADGQARAVQIDIDPELSACAIRPKSTSRATAKATVAELHKRVSARTTASGRTS